MEIKNFKKVQLWTMVRFIQYVDELSLCIQNMDSEEKMYLTDFESIKVKKGESNDVMLIYSDERPTTDYHYLNIVSLLVWDVNKQRYCIGGSTLFEIIYEGQSEPIMACFSENNLYQELMSLTNDIENEETIQGIDEELWEL